MTLIGKQIVCVDCADETFDTESSLKLRTEPNFLPKLLALVYYIDITLPLWHGYGSSRILGPSEGAE